MLFSADETCDVGKETGSTVSPDYGVEGNRGCPIFCVRGIP
jgi:hypothetical protein